MFVPRGVRHCFQNVGDAPARIVVLFTPAGMERFFDRFAELNAATPDAFREVGSGVGMEVAVPLLPTTPFLLVAAYAASRSSTRLHAWLLGHQLFGGTIRRWQEHRAVARRAKLAASGMMAASAAVLFLVSPAPLAAAATTLACVGAWLWLRPEPPAP